MAALDVEKLVRGLTGGMGIAGFDREVRERRVAKFGAAMDAPEVGALFCVSKLDALFQRDAIPVAYVDLFDGGQLRRLADVLHKSGKSSVAVLAEGLRAGATLRVRDVEKFDADVGRFAREVQRAFAARAQINVYLTPPSKAGFTPHFDTTDVFIVQCAGKKEWRIYPQYSNQKELPLLETAWDPARFRPSALGGDAAAAGAADAAAAGAADAAAAEEFALSAGDVLYLPRGAMHEAFCGERESMHLTISIVSMTFADLIGRALRVAAEEDVAYRRRVGWSVAGGDGGKELADELRELILRLAEQTNVTELVGAEREWVLGAEASASSASAGESLAATIAALVGDEVRRADL